jgi:hypothetical protein
MSAHTNGQPYVIVNGQRVNARSDYEPEPEPKKIVEEEKPKEHDGKPIVMELTGDETVTITPRSTFPVK